MKPPTRRATHGAALGAVLLLVGATSFATFSRMTGSGAREESSGLSPTAAEAEVNAAPPVFTPAEVDSVVRPVMAGIEAGAFAGASMAIGSGAGEIHEIALGSIGWTKNAPAVDPAATMYDLASLTKVVATATGIMLLVDEGRLSLDDPVSRFLPEFSEGPKAAVTIRHLLTHTSGLPAGASLLGATRDDRLARLRRFPIYPPAGRHPEYSDLGYILLWEIAGQAAGEPMAGYLDRKLFVPLGMTSTRFSPGLDCEVCAPTGRLRDQSLYRGKPFDPLAQRLDGITGSAGLFSTAHDLGRFTAMIANGGQLDGVRVLSETAVVAFTAVQPFDGPFRLGWEDFCELDPGDGDVCIPTTIVHHTGWTGTSIHLDLASGVWVVLLTNRTYEPRAENQLATVRRDVLGRALELGMDR
jgi:CubicO group peptidase (beta-lactamase class C family)